MYENFIKYDIYIYIYIQKILNYKLRFINQLLQKYYQFRMRKSEVTFGIYRIIH